MSKLINFNRLVELERNSKQKVVVGDHVTNTTFEKSFDLLLEVLREELYRDREGINNPDSISMRTLEAERLIVTIPEPVTRKRKSVVEPHKFGE